ncbi:hypothetical protein ACHAXR_006143 [Thalassiosira sp. AJA248-18]
MKVPTKDGSMPPRPGAAAVANNNTTPPSNIHKHLRKAAGAKNPTVLPAFLKDHPSLSLSDLDCAFYDGRTPLHMASWTGAISNVSLLLDMGCNINRISTRSHNYGKSPIFFAATRSREDVMNLLLDRGADVLIVNNKGQSVYSIACSHFGSELVQRIQEIEQQQQDDSKHLNGWVDYKKTHPDGNVYGDLDMRFLGRPLSESDVVKDGVVNPTTKESRKGNFARNNPHSYNSRKKKDVEKKKQLAPVTISEGEQMQLEKSWDEVQVALQTSDSWGVFSSLLSIVQFMEGKKVQSRWVVDSAARLGFLVKSHKTLKEITFEPSTESDSGETSLEGIKTLLSEAMIFCGSGDRHATLTKRMLTKAAEGPNESNSVLNRNDVKTPMTEQEKVLLERFWSEAEAALKNNNSKDAFVSLIKIVVLWDAKNCPWLNESTTKLHIMLGSISSLDDATEKEILGYCDITTTNRHASLLRKMITKSTINGSEVVEDNNLSLKNDNQNMIPSRKAKKKEHAIPDYYHSISKRLSGMSTEHNSMPSWEILMNSHPTANGETKHLSLPCPPKWVDSPHDLQCLQTRLHDAITGNSCSKCKDEITLEKLIAFDSEFRSEDGNTKLATIQFSILEDGIPLAWVVDLHPDPADTAYSTMTYDMLRWLFLVSDAQVLGFAHRHDLHMISSYIGEDIPVSPNFLDVQMLAASKMADDIGASDVPSLPGLKSCCSYFMEASGNANGQNTSNDMKSWSLSKVEQCSNWAQRPLSPSQLEYAGMDAAVLLVLLAEIIRN